MKFERFLCNIRPQSILRGSENHDTNGMEDTVPSHRKQLWFSSFSPLSLEISSCLTLRILCVLRRNRQVYMLGAHLYSCALTLRSAQNQVKMQKQKTTTNHKESLLKRQHSEGKNGSRPPAPGRKSGSYRSHSIRKLKCCQLNL